MSEAPSLDPKELSEAVARVRKLLDETTFKGPHHADLSLILAVLVERETQLRALRNELTEMDIMAIRQLARAQNATAELAKLRPQPIATAPEVEEASILASSTGKVWFQASWDEEDQCWVSFNRYVENDLKRPWKPTLWVPLPGPVE